MIEFKSYKAVILNLTQNWLSGIPSYQELGL